MIHRQHTASSLFTRSCARIAALLCALVVAFALFPTLTGCSSPDAASGPGSSPNAAATDDNSNAAATDPNPNTAAASGAKTDGPAFSPSFATATFDKKAAAWQDGMAIDTSHASDGYIAACGKSKSRLKLQAVNGDNSYNFDLPSNGSVAFFPINMGNGSYRFRIMQNTSGTNYVEALSTAENVQLSDEFQPFLRPNVFCSYTEKSTCVKLAGKLCKNAKNQGDAVKAIYEWITANVSYDAQKAQKMQDATGYIPNPDNTLSSKSGICFDYASLAAAMLRSQGIPCKIVTGYVSPDDIYHAWNMIYIDGSWHSASINIGPGSWVRIDTTFAAGGSPPSLIGDGTTYTDRYVY